MELADLKVGGLYRCQGGAGGGDPLLILSIRMGEDDVTWIGYLCGGNHYSSAPGTWMCPMGEWEVV